MNGITHKQAIQWIDRRLDGLLNENQLSALDEHLRSCDSCRAYAVDMDGLSARMQNEFHRRWDDGSVPSQNVMKRVTTIAKRIPMTSRLSSGAKLLAGSMTLIALAVAINFVVSRLQSTSPVTNATETVDAADNRLLAFTSNQNGNFDIYTIHADGSGFTNLTNNPAMDISPFWSPDGKRIAFESGRDGFGQIYLMDADGSNVIQLTKDEADHGFVNFVNDFSPWSPDGSKLIFSETLPGEDNWTLYVIDANGENKTPLVNEPNVYSAISWSPDGQHIALQADDPQNLGGTRLYVVNADGSDLREATGSLQQNQQLSSSDYYWSPDGQSIFFVAFFQKADPYWTAYEFILNDNSLIEHATANTPMYGWWNGVSLLNDFSARSPFIWKRPDGTSSTLDPHEKCQQFDASQSGGYIQRSSNGNWIIGGYCPNGGTWFYWVNSDGTVIKPLFNSPIYTTNNTHSPISWSGDDKFIAFTVSSTGESELYVLNVAEALNDPSIQPVKLSKSFGASWRPIHTPDIVENSLDLRIDPQTCKPASELTSDVQPPSGLYGYDLVQGTSFVDGDFSYEFWLYCDPSLWPDDQRNLNTVAGLGIFASWSYTGPEQDGRTEYYFAFEADAQDAPMGGGSWDGPIYNASLTDAKFGIHLPKSTLQEHIQQGTPVQLYAVINSPLGQNGAIFSFRLEPAENGVRAVDLQASQPINLHRDLITFTADSNATTNGNMDVYTVRVDGSQLTNLTHDPTKDFNGNDYNPQWSPDRKKIAFTSMRSGVNTGDTDVFTMDPDGSNLTRLTDKPGYDVLYSWSPDGKQIVYFSSSGYDPDVEGQLIVMNADGSNKTVITKELGFYYFWNWSPDGRKIIYTKQTLEGETVTDPGAYIVDVNGENPHALNVKGISNIRWEDSEHFVGVGWPENPDQAKWSLYRFSTDGKSSLELASHNAPIVAVFEKTYVVAGKDTLDWFTIGGNSSPLSSHSLAEVCGPSNNRFLQTDHKLSLDQKRAFVVLWCEDTTWFYLENEDGSEFVTLGTIDGSAGLKPEWSLDGKLVSVLTFGYKDPYAPTDLYLFDIEKILANPSTQPMQTSLSLTVMGDIVVVWPPEKNTNIAQESPTPEPTQGTASRPTLPIGTGQGNGEWIAFIGSTMVPDPTGSTALTDSRDVYLIHPDGSGLFNLTNSPDYYLWPAWSPNGRYLLFLRGDTVDILRKTEANSFEVLVNTEMKSEFEVSAGTSNIEKPFHYSWSPNSDQIAFLDNRAGNYDIYTVYADGRSDPQLKQLTNDPGQEFGFVWSPDGSQIAYQKTDGEQLSIMVMNADGSNQHEVADGAGEVNLRWSMDGNSIYVESIYRWPPENKISHLECEECVPEPAIYQIKLNGPSVHQIYSEKDAEYGWVLYDTPQNGLYFMQIRYDQPSLGIWGTWKYWDGTSIHEIGEMDPQQTCKTNTGNILNEHISPNERFSIITNSCAGGFDLYLADREAATPEQRLIHLLQLPLDTWGEGANDAYLPITWSPDGRWLIYSDGRTATYLLDIERAIQDSNTAPTPFMEPVYYTGPDGLQYQSSETITVWELVWQPAP